MIDVIVFLMVALMWATIVSACLLAAFVSFVIFCFFVKKFAGCIS